MQINLNPARGIAEPFKIYQSRRKANAIRVKNYLRGRWVWGGEGAPVRMRQPLIGKCPDRKNERRMF